MTIDANPGSPTADSYFTLDEAAAYFTARGISSWTGSTNALEAAARRGTTYLDNAYRGRWRGIANAQTQSRAWPRVDGWRTLFRAYTYPLLDLEGFQIAMDVVPVQVKQASMEAALLLLQGLTLEPTLERGGVIKSLSEQVGPLSTSTVWEDGASPLDRYTVIEGLLSGLVTSTPGASSGNVRLVRA